LEPDEKWLEEQVDYTLSLPLHQFNLLSFYSHNGDRLLNNFLRVRPSENMEYFKDILKRSSNKRKLAYYMDEINFKLTQIKIIELIFLLISELNTLILNAPKTNKPTVLYRGLKSTSESLRKDTLYETNGFLSTSFDKRIAKQFGVYMNHLLVPKGVPCLYLSPQVSEYDEAEILFSNRMCFEVLKSTIQNTFLLYKNQGQCATEL